MIKKAQLVQVNTKLKRKLFVWEHINIERYEKSMVMQDNDGNLFPLSIKNTNIQPPTH